MPYLLIAVMGLFSLMSVKVPPGTDPVVFYGVSSAVAMLLTGGLMYIATSKNVIKITYILGFVGVGLLLTLAISIMPTH